MFSGVTLLQSDGTKGKHPIFYKINHVAVGHTGVILVTLSVFESMSSNSWLHTVSIVQFMTAYWYNGIHKQTKLHEFVILCSLIEGLGA